MLTTDSVSVKIQKYVGVDGVEYQVGEPHRKAYVNSESGRAEVLAELPESQATAIMAVWGDTPTIDEDAGSAE